MNSIQRSILGGVLGFGMVSGWLNAAEYHIAAARGIDDRTPAQAQAAW